MTTYFFRRVQSEIVLLIVLFLHLQYVLSLGVSFVKAEFSPTAKAFSVSLYNKVSLFVD